MIVVDAITLDDVDAIARAVVTLNWNVLAVDPGPFTERLAVHRGLMREDKRLTQPSLPRNAQRGSVVIGRKRNAGDEKATRALNCA